MQDQPDETALSMCNESDSLIMSESRNATAIDILEDTSFDFHGGISRLIEYAPHVTVALGRSVAVVYACAFFVAGTGAHPRGELFPRRKGRCGGTNFSNNLLR